MRDYMRECVRDMMNFETVFMNVITQGRLYVVPLELVDKI